MDPNSDLLQIDKNCENVNHDSSVTKSTVINHNGSFSSNCNNADVSDKLDNFELSEDLVTQQSLSTLEQTEETPVIDPNIPHTPVEINEMPWFNWIFHPDSPNTVPLEKEEVKRKTIYLWNEIIKEQDAKWMRRCKEGPVMLEPYCVDFFRQVKMKMNDDELFNSWFEDQKRNNQHECHAVYGRLILEHILG